MLDRHKIDCQKAFMLKLFIKYKTEAKKYVKARAKLEKELNKIHERKLKVSKNRVVKVSDKIYIIYRGDK